MSIIFSDQYLLKEPLLNRLSVGFSYTKGLNPFIIGWRKKSISQNIYGEDFMPPGGYL